MTDQTTNTTKPKNPHAVALGRLGGSVKSERKTLAVRANALKGLESLKRKKLARKCPPYA